ncbi:transposable element Tcb2 transposase [Trichonephila clavipes]|nr:transposable element Tcb2 transposase [Trichonephila clavipes]
MIENWVTSGESLRSTVLEKPNSRFSKEQQALISYAPEVNSPKKTLLDLQQEQCKPKGDQFGPEENHLGGQVLTTSLDTPNNTVVNKWSKVKGTEYPVITFLDKVNTPDSKIAIRLMEVQRVEDPNITSSPYWRCQGKKKGVLASLHAEIVSVEIDVVSPSIVPSGNFAELNHTVTCMVLKANDRRTSCPCHDEFRGPRSGYVRQVALENNNKSQTNMASSSSGHFDSVVRRCWDQWIREMSFKQRPGSGRPRQTSRREDRNIVRNALLQPTVSSAAIQAQVVPSPGTLLEWNQLVFSDESRFNISSDGNRVRVWRPRGERLSPAFALQRHTAPTAGVMVWGVIAYNTRSPLILIRGTMTAQWYVHDILQPHMLLLMQGLPEAIFEQGNARQGSDKTAFALLLPFLGLSDPHIFLQSSISEII